MTRGVETVQRVGPDLPAVRGHTGRGGSKIPAALLILGLCTLTAAIASVAPPQAPGNDEQPETIKEDLIDGGAAATILPGGNMIYRVYLEDAGVACGTWTARTGPWHPTPNVNVLFGNGIPSTSYTTLRSYTSTTDYSTRAVGTCQHLCGVAAPQVSAILNGTTTVGYLFHWTLVDAGNTIAFEQEVVVEGPTDGSETVDNTVIRETHLVRNLGPGTLNFGLRKMWDFQIGPDDGPWLGDCQMPNSACDQSVNLLAGQYPQSYVINEDPLLLTCPPQAGALRPVTEGNCVAARRGGEQPEVNDQSVGQRTRFGRAVWRACWPMAKPRPARAGGLPR